MLVQATMLSALKVRPADGGATPANAPATTGQTGAPPQNQPAPEADEGADLQHTLHSAQEAADAAGANLQFTIDKDSGKTVVKVVDSATSEVIRQIPSEELLALARHMTKTEGMLISQKA